jgi:hypothetical protein
MDNEVKFIGFSNNIKFDPCKPFDYLQESPNFLWKNICEYFNFIDDHPIFKNEQSKNTKGNRPQIKICGDLQLDEQVASQLNQLIVPIPIQRPYTIESLCFYIKISKTTFDKYSRLEESEYITKETAENFRNVCEAALQFINSQHFEYSLTGIYNPLIALNKLEENKSTMSLAKMGDITYILPSAETKDKIQQLKDKFKNE